MKKKRSWESLNNWTKVAVTLAKSLTGSKSKGRAMAKRESDRSLNLKREFIPCSLLQTSAEFSLSRRWQQWTKINQMMKRRKLKWALSLVKRRPITKRFADAKKWRTKATSWESVRSRMSSTMWMSPASEGETLLLRSSTLIIQKARIHNRKVLTSTKSPCIWIRLQ